jgi:hypothetical protein
VINGFFIFFHKTLAGKEKVCIFAETESATLPDDQRTRAGLLFLAYGNALYQTTDKH